jgi:hypothetical protein
MAKQPSRSARWSEACQQALDALENLASLQSEYQDWRDNLPESLESSSVGEKLDTVCELDIEGVRDTIQEAADVDLPLGFGRD